VKYCNTETDSPNNLVKSWKFKLYSTLNVLEDGSWEECMDLRERE
jgi:hypothetical protein